MKIQKQFIPLILDGIKKYEFRNTNNKEYLYFINGDYYYLKYIDVIVCKVFDELLKTIELNFIIDSISRKWIKNNKEYFYRKSELNSYVCYVYKWVKCELKKLEIIENV